MNKFIQISVSAFLLITCISVNAQFTEGGSIKSYEKYRYQVDTIIKKRTITNTTTLPQNRQSYFYLSFGVLAPLSPSFKTQPDPNSSIQSSYQSDITNDGMGGKTGGAFSIGGFYAFKGLNNKIIPLIDLGLGQNHTFSIHSYDWKSVNNFYSTNVKYRPFVSFASSIAPTVIINPLWKKGIKLRVEAGYKLGAAVIFGGGQYGTDSFSYEITRSEFLKPHFMHGPTVRIRYSVLMLGLDMNFMKDNTKDAFNYYYYDSNNGSVDIDFDSRTNLSNFTFSLGLAF